MNDFIKNKRNVIQRVLIIFLVIMLVLTFFSNTIMNKMLPEVAVVAPESGVITTRMTGSGTVTANQTYQVSVEETRVIKEVNVKVGTKVSRGDVLYTLADGESEELIRAIEELTNLQIEYKNMIAENDVTTVSYLSQVTAKQAEIDAKEKEIERKAALLEEKETALSNPAAYAKIVSKRTADYNAANETVTNLKNDIKRYTALKSEVLQGVDIEESIKVLTPEALKKLKEGEEGIFEEITAVYEEDKAVYERTKALYDNDTRQLEYAKQQLEEIKAIQKEYYNLLDCLTPEGENPSTYTTQKLMLLCEELREQSKVITEYKRAQERYNNLLKQSYVTASAIASAKTALEDAKAAYEDLDLAEHVTFAYFDMYLENVERAFYYPDTSDNDFVHNTETYNAFVAELKKINEDIKTKNSLIATIESSIEKTKADYEAAQEVFGKQQSEYTTEKTKFENKSAKYEALLKSYEYQEMVEELKTKLTAEENELKLISFEKDYSEFLVTADEKSAEAINGLVEREINSLKNELSSLEKELDTLLSSTSTTSTGVSSSDDVLNMKLSMLEAQIDAKSAAVQKLKSKANNGTITAPVSGIVSSLSYTAGEKTSAGAYAATITLSEKGYTLTYSMSSEQAARISVGETATVLNYRYGNVPVMTVASIRNDASSKGRTKIVTFTVTGDINDGESLSFAIGSKGANYDCVVPNNAIREDSNGKFVLVVRASSTPFGNRYKADRVDVTINASDDTKSAISGAALGSEYIITSSSSPIASGVQVRLSNE